MDTSKIGKLIATRRKEKGLTQQELGDKLYVTDKAVSKWERGISLPDLSILENLALELDLSIEDILNGEITKDKDIDIDKKISDIKDEMDKINKKKKKRVIIVLALLIFVLFVVIFKNLYLGYSMRNVYYEHSDKYIDIGFPKLSFNIKNNDLSYSSYNIRGKYILENEVKKYLKTLKYSNCNNTIYYYDEVNDVSIIDYNINNKILFNTISYTVSDHDYCESKRIDEYKDKLNGINRFHLLNGGKLSLDMKGNFVEIALVDGIKEDDNIDKEFFDYDKSHYTYKAQLKVMYYIRLEDLKDKGIVERKILENSIGTIEIKEDKLYYYREKVIETSLDLPEVSIFQIGEEGFLTLTNNYLSKYQEEITLK